MLYDWGPYYLVPSKSLPNYSGKVLLREEFNEELLRKQIDDRKLCGKVVKVTNLWFYRKKNAETWTKIGESADIRKNFPVKWDTTCLKNGQYEIIGFMQAFVKINDPIKWEAIGLGKGEYDKFGFKPIYRKKHCEKRVLGEQNIVEVNVKN